MTRFSFWNREKMVGQPRYPTIPRFYSKLTSFLETRFFQAKCETHKILGLLALNALDPAEEKRLAEEHNTRLSPQDRWDNNGIISYLTKWSESLPYSDSVVVNRSPTLLWVGGQCGPRDPWVTGFSASLIKTLRDEGVKIAYIFCEASIGLLHSEVDFVKILLARILEQLPTLILELPHLLNARALQRALTPEKIWEVMEAVAKRLPTYF